MSLVYVMRVEHIYDPEVREEFDEWLFEPIDLRKKTRTPEEEYEIAMARYELGLVDAPPIAPTVLREGEVISFGGDR